MNDRAKKLAEWDAANRKHIADLTDTYIKKLAVTTGIYDCITDPYDALKNGDSYSSVMPDLVKFAELIVQDCIMQIKLTMVRDGHDTRHYKQSRKHIETICEHFGIKEE